MKLWPTLFGLALAALASACAASSSDGTRQQPITLQEARSAGSLNALSAEQLASRTSDYMTSADTDGDRIISREEFAAQVKKENPQMPSGAEGSAILDTFFNNIDTDKSGTISEVEVALLISREASQSCSSPDCQ